MDLLIRLNVPPNARLAFRLERASLPTEGEFLDLGQIVRAERRMNPIRGEAGVFDQDRIIIDCKGIEAADVRTAINPGGGEPVQRGIVRFGEMIFAATLQVEDRKKGLRAIVRRINPQ